MKKIVSHKCSPLGRALFVAYGGPYAIAAGLKILQDLLAFLQPQLLRLLLSYISRYQSARFQPEGRPSELEGFAIAIIMFVASVTQTVCLNQVSCSSHSYLQTFVLTWSVCSFLKYFQRTFETG